MIHDRDYMRSSSSEPGRQRLPAWTLVHLIIIVNVLAYLLGPNLIDLDGSGPRSHAEVGRAAGLSLEALAAGRFWTLLLHMFVHTSPWHLIGNMLIIALAGRSLLQLVGSRVFLLLYFLGGLVGGLFQVCVSSWVQGLADESIVGASACACAVGFALAVILPEDNATSMIYFITPVRLRLWTLAVVLLAFEIFLGVTALVSPIAQEWWGHNAYFAHVGGALLGWYLMKLMGFGGSPLTYSRLWHQQGQDTLQAPVVRRPARRVAARMRRLQEAAPDMDHEAIRRKRERPERSTVPQIEEVDEVLEKIHREGMGSLSERERRILETASRELKEKPKRK